MNFALPYIYYYFSVFLGIFSSQMGRDFKKITKLLFIFVTIYFIGLRGFVEADWLIYYPVWKIAPSLFEGSDAVFKFLSNTFYEKGFAFLLVICKTLCNNYIFLQFVILLFTLFCLNSFLTRYCNKYYYLGACLFYLFGGYMLSIIMIRNCISVMFFILSIPSLIERNWKKYFLQNFIGLLFHSSSFFYFPLYFFLHIRYKNFLIIPVWLIGNAIFLLQIPLAMKLFSSVSGVLFGAYGHLVTNYLTSKQYATSYGISIGFIERTLTFLLFFSKRKSFYNKEALVFLNMFYLYSFVFLFFSDFRIVVDRIPILIYCCYWFLYPKFYGFLTKRTKVIFLLILLMYSLIKIVMFFGTPIGLYENVVTGAMSYENRKEFTMREVKP